MDVVDLCFPFSFRCVLPQLVSCVGILFWYSFLVSIAGIMVGFLFCFLCVSNRVNTVILAALGDRVDLLDLAHKWRLLSNSSSPTSSKNGTESVSWRLPVQTCCWSITCTGTSVSTSPTQAFISLSSSISNCDCSHRSPSNVGLRACCRWRIPG